MKTIFLPEHDTGLAKASGKSVNKCVVVVLLGAVW